MLDIPGFEGKYAITKDGKVWSYPKPLTGALEGKGYTKGKWMKPSICYHGYPNVFLGKSRSFRIHKLVAITYLPRIKGKNCINHKNSIRSDNSIENLEWVTHSENTRHAIKKGRIKFPIKKKKLTLDQAKEIIDLYKNKTLQKDILRKFNIEKELYYKILNGFYYPQVRAQKNITQGRIL